MWFFSLCYGMSDVSKESIQTGSNALVPQTYWNQTLNGYSPWTAVRPKPHPLSIAGLLLYLLLNYTAQCWVTLQSNRGRTSGGEYICS